MKRLAGAGALVAIAVGLSASVGGLRANAARTSGGMAWPPTESSSRFIAHGRVSCTASLKSAVQVGHAVTVRFTLHNRSRHAVTVSVWALNTGFVLDAPDGTRYDTNAPYKSFPGIPPPTHRKIRARATWHFRTISVPVRWRGPLLITPRCLGAKLHPLRVQVSGPWPSPGPSAAIGEVVAAAGHLFDHCLPQTPGVPVDGQIYAPSSAAPMDARCSISISSEGTFLVAQALVLIPPDLQGVQVHQPYETLWPIDNPFAGLPTSDPPYEAIAWEFVVTRERAIPVASATIAATCGGAKSFGWSSRRPDIQYISACPS